MEVRGRSPDFIPLGGKSEHSFSLKGVTQSRAEEGSKRGRIAGKVFSGSTLLIAIIVSH